jgi:hypothetical protein
MRADIALFRCRGSTDVSQSLTAGEWPTILPLNRGAVYVSYQPQAENPSCGGPMQHAELMARMADGGTAAFCA